MGKKAGMQLVVESSALVVNGEQDVDAAPRVIDGGHQWGSRRGSSTPRRRWRLGEKRSSSARWSSAVDGEVREGDAAIELTVDAARPEEARIAELWGVGGGEEEWSRGSREWGRWIDNEIIFGGIF